MSDEIKGPSAPEAKVVARNAAVLGELPFADRRDFADAERGFIATLPDAIILTASGHPAWSSTAAMACSRCARASTRSAGSTSPT